MSENKFKVGDLIGTLYNGQNCLYECAGHVAYGKIVAQDKHDCFLIEFDNKVDGNIGDKNLEVYSNGFLFNDFKEGKSYWQIEMSNIVTIQVKATRLAKKMYPNAKQEGDYLLIPEA